MLARARAGKTEMTLDQTIKGTTRFSLEIDGERGYLVMFGNGPGCSREPRRLRKTECRWAVCLVTGNHGEFVGISEMLSSNFKKHQTNVIDSKGISIQPEAGNAHDTLTEAKGEGRGRCTQSINQPQGRKRVES